MTRPVTFLGILKYSRLAASAKLLGGIKIDSSSFTVIKLSSLKFFGSATADPKNFSEDNFITVKDEESILIPPNSFALAASLEYFKMPRNVTGLVTAKSTYARCGLGVPPTVLEAGWEGVLVLEFSNHTSNSIRLYANSGAAQILFFQGEQPEVSYADRKGKYQFQQGITLAKSK